jgi:F-type H+-transporting ATPase subunit delta
VEFEESVDPSLLGGAVATVGGLVFDGSLRTQLEQLRASLTKGY